MKERPIDFSIQDKPAIVEDPNGELISELKNQYRDIQSNLGTCITMLEKGHLTEGMKEDILSLTDHNVNEFLTKMGYEGVLADKHKKIHSEIRSLYDENRQLRQQLGQKVSNEDVRERLKIMAASFDTWWDEYGFGHCNEFTFSGHKAKAVLSGMIFGSKSHKEYLSELGFEIEDERVVYNDNSAGILKKLILDKYPSADIYHLNIHLSVPNRMPVIQDVTIYIRDLNDLFEPEPATE